MRTSILRVAVTCSLLSATSLSAAEEPPLLPSPGPGEAQGGPPPLPQPPNVEGPRTAATPTPASRPSDRQAQTGRVLLIVGGSVLAGTYLLSALPGVAMGADHRLAIPVVGPLWLGGEVFSNFPGCQDSLGCVVGAPFVALYGVGLLLSGVLQAIGTVTMLGGAVALGTSRPAAPRLSVLPYGTRGEGGLTLLGRF